MFLCVTAKETGTTAATPAKERRLDVALFDRLAEAAGARDDQAKAELIGVDRVTLWRYRRGKLQPGIEVAFRMADRLGVTVDQLFPRRSA